MALWMLVTFHLWAALHAVPNSEQPDPEFIPFCNAVSHHVYDGLYTLQAYNCTIASERSDRRMPLTIVVMEAPPERVAGQPEYLHSKYLGISLDPLSVHCERDIWDETKGVQVTKALLTAVNNPLEKLSSIHHYYNDFPDLEECYILPPIVFYNIPEVTVSMDSEANGDRLHLTCLIINVAPVQNLTVRWLRGDRIKSSVSFRELSIHDSQVTQFNISESLTVHLNKENGEMYTCQAELNLEPYDVILRNHSIRVPAEPKALLDFEQRDFNFSLLCEMDPIPLRSKWKDIPYYNRNQAYSCSAISEHSGQRMHFLIFEIEVTPEQAERFAVCPLADSYHNSMKKFNDPGSQRCHTNIRSVWGNFWKEKDEGYVFKFLLTIVNGTLKDWSTKRQCYTDESDLTKCYVLPPIVFYEIPDVRAHVEPESGPMLAGNHYSLVCDIVNVAPVHKLTVKWLRGDKIVKSVSYSDPSSDDIDVTLHNISDSFTIWASGDENGQIYTCQAELNLEPFDVFLRNSSMNITVEFSGSSAVPGSSAGLVAVILACVIVLLVVLILVLNRKKLSQYSCKG